MRMFNLSLFLILGVLFTFPSNVINERYFIASSLEQCDSHVNVCLSLSSFAASAGDDLQLSRNATEVILSPGNHTLHSKLTVAHVNHLWFHSNVSRSLVTTIVCIDHAARFEFTNVTHVHISDVKFLGCGGNRALSVMELTLINAVFDGQKKEELGTALELVNSSLKAERSSFVYNIYGGAVIVNESAATFLNCSFEGNHAQRGGAIYGNLSSNVSIADSTFLPQFC